MSRNIVLCSVLLSLAMVSLVGLSVAVPRINAWEKANAYPYGKMCNSIFTGYADTCRR